MPKLVLIVEEHLDTAQCLERLLRFAGYEAVAAPTGPEALRLLTVRVPAAVVLDCPMSDMSGLDVLRAVRRDPRTESVSVVMYTADVSPECREEAMRLGANEFLVKGRASWDSVLAAVSQHAGKP